MRVSLLIGAAHAYACVRMEGRSLDIRLEPGRSAPVSLREYAASERLRAAAILDRANVAEDAAAILESSPSS